jgi:hypothetical protein
MTRNLERDVFRMIQRRQQVFMKVAVLGFSLSAVLFLLSAAYRLPLFLALIPIGLTGPFMVNVASARCPHCQKPLHRNILGVFRRLDYCGRCGFPR